MDERGDWKDTSTEGQGELDLWEERRPGGDKA